MSAVPWEIVSPALIGAAAVAIALLERAFPYDRDHRFLREGFWTDLLGYTLLQSYVLALVIAEIIRFADQASGLSHFCLLSGWPVWLQVACFVVTHDLYIYWFHRLQHANPVLWRLHEAHHSNTRLDWLAGARSHSLEILINQTIEFAPMVLLGAAPHVPLIKGMVSAVWGLWIHANLDARTGRLQWLVNGPEAHRWHHATDPDAHNLNFATKLALWDRLFGTAFLPPGRKPKGYGLGEVVFPRGYVEQHLFAFRPFTPTADALQVAGPWRTGGSPVTGARPDAQTPPVLDAAVRVVPHVEDGRSHRAAAGAAARGARRGNRCPG